MSRTPLPATFRLPRGDAPAAVDYARPPMRSVADVTVLDRRLVAAVLILLAANLLVGNAKTALWDQDEAAYAGFARNMLVNHNWVVPTHPYSQPHRKPPLFFWMLAGSYALFGINEFAARLPSVLAVVATGLAVWRGGRFLLGAHTASLAAIVLVSMLFVLNLGKIALTDAVLLFFQTLAALALLRAAVRPALQDTLILWSAVAAGVLIKGPPILILIGGMFLFLLIFHPRRRNLLHLHPWFGLPLALVPLTIWLRFAWQADPRYVLFLGYWYILRRAGGTTFGQAGPPGTYLALFFFLWLPWTGYLLAALRDAWHGLRCRRLPFLLLGAWLFGGWIVWELPLSKLPTYPLAAFPALAFLIARQVRPDLAGRARWNTDKSLRIGFRLLVMICLVTAGALLGLALWRGQSWAKALAFLPAAAIVVTGWLATRQQQRAQPAAAVRSLMLGGLVANLLVWLIVIPGFESQRAVSRRIAQTLASHCRPGSTVVGVRRLAVPSLPFYVEQSGLRFEEILPPALPQTPLVVDWSLLGRLRFAALVRQVKAQLPPSRSETEDRTARLARVAELCRTDAPCAFVMDEGQLDALHEVLRDAAVLRIRGWIPDRLAETTYVLAIRPAAQLSATAPAR